MGGCSQRHCSGTMFGVDRTRPRFRVRHKLFAHPHHRSLLGLCRRCLLSLPFHCFSITVVHSLKALHPHSTGFCPAMSFISRLFGPDETPSTPQLSSPASHDAAALHFPEKFDGTRQNTLVSADKMKHEELEDLELRRPPYLHVSRHFRTSALSRNLTRSSGYVCRRYRWYDW